MIIRHFPKQVEKLKPKIQCNINVINQRQYEKIMLEKMFEFFNSNQPTQFHRKSTNVNITMYNNNLEIISS